MGVVGREVCGVGRLRCGGVAEWVVFGRESCGVGLLPCGGFACLGEFLVWGSCGVWQLRCGECCSMGEFWCGDVAM